MDILQPLRPVVNKDIPPGNTVANSIIEKKFASGFTLPANTLQVGDAIVIHTAGVFSVGVMASTITAKGQLGPQQVLTPPVLDVNVGTNWGWSARTTLLVLAVGVNGQIDTQSTLTFMTDTAAGTTLVLANPNPVNIDLSVDQDYNVFVKWNKAHTGNTMTLRQFIAQMLRPIAGLVK